MGKPLESKVITCLDGKERIFSSYGANSISYRIYKDGEATGRTFIIKAEDIARGKYPKFVTAEMLSETSVETDVEPEVDTTEAEPETAPEAEEINPDIIEATNETEPTGRTIGYMRISTLKDEQKFDRQEVQLKEAGCSLIYADRMSGAKRDRPELDRMLSELQAGDTVLIVSIDRLSRSTKHLLEIVEQIKTAGASLKSISDSWLDTTADNPLHDFLLTVLGALGQMERAMITQRVREGVKVAKDKGVKFGRPTANRNKVDYALELYQAGGHTSQQIADITGISRATLYRKIRELES